MIRALVLLLLLPVAAWAVPPTPTNTPVAHPLAPNPHTSVGLFWIYTDASTGRQWTGGTYKVKRCSGAACTPTTVVASGLTNADYQDTGLSTNTIYGYRYVANDGSDSGDSPTVYVTTLSADSSAVQFPNAKWDELLGPLVEAAQIPFTYYNSTATTNGVALIAKYPVAGVGSLTGTGSITNNTTALTGTGTFFLEQVAANNPANTNHIKINGVDAGTIASVNSNTSITLTTTWTGGTQTNVALSTNVALGGFSDPLNDYLTGNQLYYYDSPMALWQLYFRTGDPQYMRGAIKGSEAIFAGYMWLGRNRAWNGFSTTANTDNMPAPRNFQFSGYVLLGMAGHNGVWDLLDIYLANRYPTWISNYRGGSNEFRFLREKAYMILFTTWFVTAAPDSFPRSNGTTTSLNGGTTVDGSLATGRKGFWRDELNTDLPGFITDDQTSYGIWLETDAQGDYGEGDITPFTVTGISQPFQLGLLGDALGYCWKNSILSSTARNASRKMVLKLAAALGHLGYNTNIAPDATSFRWRHPYGMLGMGHRLNPYAFRHGGESAFLNNTPDPNMFAWYRQSLPLMLTTFGWAWEMSGHQWYKDMGDEMANAAFAEIGENTIGSGADGKKSLIHSTSNWKDYGQGFRTSARYFGQRLTTPPSLGTAPVVTMPGNVTLTGGVNQVTLTASVSSSNTPLTYWWVLEEYPTVSPRFTARPVFLPDDALATKLCGLEAGVYKVRFYALDNLGLEGHGTVTVTVGDGVYPPTVVMGEPSGSAVVSNHFFLTTSSSINGLVLAYSGAGRTLTHSFSGTAPKDKSAPTVTPTGGTNNVKTFSVSGLSAGLWTVTDTVTDSAGAVRKATMFIRHTAEAQPSGAHNTIPLAVTSPNHILPVGSTSTKLYVVPLDPEGIAGYASSATGYTLGYNGSAWLVLALTHSWSQTGGPVSATITNGTTLQPTITGLTQPGTYTFQYSGTDQQSDITTLSISVTVQSGFSTCKWSTSPPCQ